MKTLVLLLQLSCALVLSGAQMPNLVFMIADDCTYLDMEVYGGQAKTPHLNKLAKEGLKFTRCFQTAPMCSPTRILRRLPQGRPEHQAALCQSQETLRGEQGRRHPLLPLRLFQRAPLTLHQGRPVRLSAGVPQAPALVGRHS